MNILDEQPSSIKFDENSEHVAAISPPDNLNQQSEAQLDQPKLGQSDQDKETDPTSGRVMSAPSRVNG